ncbi:C1-like protein [Corchorus olitorius]|uniref:C1-like protein n=1 Tax=Corchorus olitorius TaxID=93759 RepID=A0A1R3JQC7_9ROSI|nr:C1-like protein [Corchorus olitorius]
MEIKHFSHEHPLVLVEEHSHESDGDHQKACCSGCGELVSVDLHIKCALLSYNIAEKKIGELQHISRIDPLISMENCNEELQKAECFVCWKPLLGSTYLSPDCGFYLHERCVDLPAEINLLWHPQHSLALQFNSERLPCSICRVETQRRGFVYCCSHCEFVLDFECSRRCITVHKDCISLPRIIKFYRHPHRLLHTYFLDQHEFEMWECRVCREEVKKEYGGYFYSKCKFIVHAKCATEDAESYFEVDSVETDDEEEADSMENGKHLCYQHVLALMGEEGEIENDNNKRCNGCTLSITS